MRYVLALAVLLAIAPAGSAAAADETLEAKKPRKTYGLLLVARADRHFRRARSCELSGRLVLTRNPRRYRLPHSNGYRRRAWKRWQARSKRSCSIVFDPFVAIPYVFGPHGGDAIDVSGCETGGTYWTGSHNGQYLGLFQMGKNERARYGHGSTAIAQARAAKRYFDATGQDWSPWECQP